jgi:penicillin-binding protein 1A
MLRFLAWMFGTAMIVGVAILVYVGIYVGGIARNLPDYEVLAEYEPSVTTRVHAGDGSLIAEYARERRIYVPHEAIPPNLKEAFLSAEDKNFYRHGGVDLKGIARAAIDNVGNYMNDRRLVGASTITQQVAKNFLLTSDQKLDRKVKEALLAFRIEKAFEKEEILELYLNEIYLGMGSYGVAAAALNYFDKSLTDLSIAQMAYLAAVPKAPSNYHPIRQKERAVARRNWVISRMFANGYITQEDLVLAQAEPLDITPRRRGAQTAEVEYFVERVRRRVYNIYGDKSLYDGGLSIRTTIDTTLQSQAVNALRTGLVNYDVKHGWRGPLMSLALDEVNEEGQDWEEQFAAAKLPRDQAPWKPAVVLEALDETAIIAFRDGTPNSIIALKTMIWARPWTANPDKRSGEIVEATYDVLKRGDVVMVEPVYEVPTIEEPEEEILNPELAEIIEYADPLEGLEPVDDTVIVEETRFEDEIDMTPQLTHYALRQIPDVNGAIVAIDPHTGRVLAMSGGFSFELSEFNRATQAKRQPGSSFKPFVYAAALDRGYTPSSLVLDAPFVIDQGANQGWWKPSNYEAGEFFGPSTLRMGIEKSRNVMTVRLAQEIGMAPIVENARIFGINDNMQPVLSMALGAGETTLYKMTTAYAQLVNGGKKVTPTLIDRIQDRHGKTIYRHDQRTCDDCNAQVWEDQAEPFLTDDRSQVIDPRTAYQVVSMLEGVVLRGTGRTIRTVGKPIGGKTGTTNEQKDAWFIGFSADLAVGVFIGFDSPKPMGRSATGGGVAAPVVRDFFQAAIGDTHAVPFRTPEGIRLVRINRDTGLLARAGDRAVILEAFKPGTEPTGVAPQVIGGGEFGVHGENNSADLESGTGGLY